MKLRKLISAAIALSVAGTAAVVPISAPSVSAAGSATVVRLPSLPLVMKIKHKNL